MHKLNVKSYICHHIALKSWHCKQKMQGYTLFVYIIVSMQPSLPCLHGYFDIAILTPHYIPFGFIGCNLIIGTLLAKFLRINRIFRVFQKTSKLWSDQLSLSYYKDSKGWGYCHESTQTVINNLYTYAVHKKKVCSCLGMVTPVQTQRISSFVLQEMPWL